MGDVKKVREDEEGREGEREREVENEQEKESKTVGKQHFKVYLKRLLGLFIK